MIFLRLIAAILILGLSSINALAVAGAQDEMEAQAVLTRYFDALSQGDTLTLRSLMGGDLLEKRSRLLDNPSYPAFLVETYGSARYSIDNMEIISPTDIAVEASITFDQESTAQRRFLLRKEPSDNGAAGNYLIYRDDIKTAP